MATNSGQVISQLVSALSLYLTERDDFYWRRHSTKRFTPITNAMPLAVLEPNFRASVQMWVVQLLADVLTDAFECTATWAVSVVRLVMDQRALKLWRQRRALGLLLFLGLRWSCLQGLKLSFNCRDHAAVGPVVTRQGQAATGGNAAPRIGEVGGTDIKRTSPYVQDTAAHILEAAGVQRQVAVGGFQCAAAAIKQPTNLKLGLATRAQSSQLAALVIYTGRADTQGGIAFYDAFLVVQHTTEVEVDLPACNMPTYIAAVIKTAAADLDRAFGVQPAVAVVEGADGDDGVAGLCRDASAVIVQAGAGEDQALCLDNADRRLLFRSRSLRNKCSVTGTSPHVSRVCWTTRIAVCLPLKARWMCRRAALITGAAA